jgi:large subunit ribosomal protein L7/L12
MSAATDTILEQLKTLSLLEAAELVKQIEEAFGVSAAAPVGVAAAATAAPEAEAEVKTEFNVVLEGLSDDTKKIAVLKVVRAITGLGLKEAKDLVESTPKDVLTGVPQAAADDAKKQLEEAGGKVSLK